MLGETRNVSIREARGDYIILHIDTDDVWEPYIKDFIKVFHRIERALGRDIYLQGSQIGIGKKDLLIKHGPYRNTFMEDRDMSHRFSAAKCYYKLDHKVFRERMPMSQWKKITKMFRVKLLNYLLYEFRTNDLPGKHLLLCLLSPFIHNPNKRSLKYLISRSVLAFPAYFMSRKMERLPLPPIPPSDVPTYVAKTNVRERFRGTYLELMTMFGESADLSYISEEARGLFEVEEQK